MPVYSALFGNPFIINTTSNGLENDADVVALAGGGFVSAWVTVGQDGSQDGVFAQIFDAAGTPVGSEFQVNTLTTSNQDEPHIVALSDGGFSVFYTSFGLDGSIGGIAMQRFSAAGTAVGEETIVNENGSSQQRSSVAGVLGDGVLVAAYSSTPYGGIAGRIVPTTGEPTADEFQVHTFTPIATSAADAPDLAVLADGSFVVVYQTADLDSSSYGMYAQRFDSGGNRLGEEFQLHTSEFAQQWRGTVTALTDGGFVAAWDSGHLPGTPSHDIFARVFNADGTARTAEIHVGPVDSRFGHMPESLGLSDGTFLLSWRDNGHYAQRYAADGSALGEAFQVTSDVPSSVAPLRMTELANGDVIAVWNSNRNDDDGAHIMGQRLFTAGEIYGTAGNDYLTGAQLGDRIQGLGGNDTLLGLDGTDTLIGGDGNDSLVGGSSENDLRDVLFGGDGMDFLDGGYGNDQLRGDGGNDTIVGGFGVDEIFGGADDDELTGQAWSDLIFGGDGNDFINGGFGFDRVNGGNGADRFFHIGNEGHGSDWIQDYNAAQGDVLQYGGSATRDQFQVNFTETANAGAAGVEEAFVIYRPTGQILWALVDGRGQSEINLSLGGDVFDLLS